MEKNYIGPHFICLTEHHLKETEMTKFSLKGYTLASEHCIKESLGRGVCVLINKHLVYQSIDLNQFCCEKTLEICAVNPKANYLLYIQGVPGGMSNTSGECSLC
jgi:hypothetical protein